VEPFGGILKGKTYTVPLCFLLLLTLFSTAFARVEFRIDGFTANDFRNTQRLEEHCNQPASASFWCDRLDEELSLITTKGADFVFNRAGEVVALFAKEQKGMDFNRNYSIDANQNLIPYTARIPGGAVLLDGEYLQPTEVSGNWQRSGETTFRGTFSYMLGDVQVEKTVTVSHVAHTMDVEVVVSRTTEADEPLAVQYAYPGLGRTAQPVIKIGQGENHTLNPLQQPVADPAYISLQTNNRNSGFALIMRPSATATQDLAALHLPPNVIGLQKTLGPDADASVIFDVQTYGGVNELVRYHQEGYADLPGLFNPNILGRMSLGVLALLAAIHTFVGSWGLAIIVLTLIFRVLIWPLISTQTKSMVEMQQLQPKLQALQKKYKDNREKLTQETMKLYQEAGVNPAGGCLPMFIQMPLFIILWRVFANFEFNEGFLWIPDLGLPDPTYILPILYVGVMVGQSFLMAKGNPQSLRMQLMMNVVFIFFVISFPAGVTLYWVVSMLVQVLQYYLIHRKYPTPATAT
jgi:YidC/Oxa1 family membrane protein insertase